jgi:hypothetical protein
MEDITTIEPTQFDYSTPNMLTFVLTLLNQNDLRIGNYDAIGDHADVHIDLVTWFKKVTDKLGASINSLLKSLFGFDLPSLNKFLFYAPLIAGILGGLFVVGKYLGGSKTKKIKIQVGGKD